MDSSKFAAELCQHRNNTVAVPRFSYPNPIPRTFDTDTDTDPDPDLASPSAFSDDHWPKSAQNDVASRQWLPIRPIRPIIV